MNPIDNVVSGSPETPVTTTTNPPAEKTPAAGEDLAALRTELATLKGQVTEQSRNSEYWYRLAMERSEGSAVATPAAPQPEEDVDVLDVITSKGAKGLDEILAKRGYVRADEVDLKVNTRANQLIAEQQIMSDYPDLKDQNSEFFRATAAHYGRLKKEGVPEGVAMKLAAQAAELDGFKSGKRKSPQQADDAATREQQRQARIRAQAGDRGSRTAEPEPGGEGDDELNENEKLICRAMGITEEAYKKRAQQGVQMYSGRGRK